jgi:septum formation protein
VPFRCRAPAVDEDALKDPRLAPGELAERLALAKAESLEPLEPAATILGCDQVLAWNGRVYGKPGSEPSAIEQLCSFSGNTIELITAVAVWGRGHRFTHTDVATLTMRRLTRAEIERYVAADRPLDCAGSFKLEARGICLFERIESCDYSAIIGLPLIALTTMLRDLGFEVP